MGRMIPNENSWIGFLPNTSVAKLAAPTQTAPATSTTGGNGSLNATTTYYYKVTAVNANGETVGSSEQSVTTGAGATNTNTINWTAVSGATGYNIYRGTASGQEVFRLNSSALTGASTSITDGTAGTTTGGNAGYATPPLVNTTGVKLGISQPTTLVPSAASDLAFAVDLTSFVISITANTTGNTVPTPNLKTKFETSIQGTVGATFTADFYRDDANDLAWATLPRGTKGYMVISRFGGSSTTVQGMPVAGDIVEVWPIVVAARSASNMASNTAEMFTLTASVPVQPNESAVVTT
jgi:hypothetical protein